MLGKNIEMYRKAKGLSQEIFAQEIGVVRQTVSKWENEKAVPDAIVLQKIAHILDVNVETLLGEKKTSSLTINEIAAQLEVLNSQLARDIKRRRIVSGIVLSVVFIFIVIGILLIVLKNPGATAKHPGNCIEIFYELNGNEGNCIISFGENKKVEGISYSAELEDFITEKYRELGRYTVLDAAEWAEQIQNHIKENGGKVKKVVNEEGGSCV